MTDRADDPLSPSASARDGLTDVNVVETDDAPGPPKPAGVPGKWIVMGVVIGSLLITAAFFAVKLVRADPRVQNRATLGFTDGLGALERIVQLRQGMDDPEIAADDDAVVALQKQEAAEWELAERSFADSVETGIARPAAVGWLAELKRRNGELAEAERLFDQVLAESPPPQALNAEELTEDEAKVPDPADLGGRALVRFAKGDEERAAADARRALELLDAGAPTRAGDVWAAFAPPRDELERIAAADPGA
ncbi:hypothetical protein [Alienimonas californiensis]|uniref:Tetratricopeptide repeat protein n=1 Tax=Alienimonas californiensis TaxID=2527989 RepID=A0A517PD86_9PLAN|nr:hypothetical protein [Alienimonas californiensis]QDT17336.1 hypothetical protein CA12_34560 [Alienimonas californiensis]